MAGTGTGDIARWVADQLGYASTRMTLDTYAHAMREEASVNTQKRPYMIT